MANSADVSSCSGAESDTDLAYNESFPTSGDEVESGLRENTPIAAGTQAVDLSELLQSPQDASPLADGHSFLMAEVAEDVPSAPASDITQQGQEPAQIAAASSVIPPQGHKRQPSVTTTLQTTGRSLATLPSTRSYCAAQRTLSSSQATAPLEPAASVVPSQQPVSFSPDTVLPHHQSAPLQRSVLGTTARQGLGLNDYAPSAASKLESALSQAEQLLEGSEGTSSVHLTYAQRMLQDATSISYELSAGATKSRQTQLLSPRSHTSSLTAILARCALHA